MEIEGLVTLLTVSQLIKLRRPLTGASCLTPSSPTTSHSQPKDGIPRSSDEHPKRDAHDCQNPNPKFLKPLTHTVRLIGTVNLPLRDSDSTSNSTPSSCLGTSCLTFSDGSATVCCDVLDLDVRLIGKQIRVLAWNFIPFDRGSGFLEIIRWSYPPESSAGLTRCSFNFDAFTLFSGSSVDNKENPKARRFIYGALESLSPVSVVRANSFNSISGSNANESITKLTGFLVQFLVCECQLCNFVNSVTALKNLILGKFNHCFTKPVIVYFCGGASSWHPVLSKLISKVVSLSGLKKKMVLIGTEESQLMYVTTENSVLHLPKLLNVRQRARKTDIKGKGVLGTYVGTVTAIYIQGMVVELDCKVLLLLTDQQLHVPHSLRAGAIVTVENVHFVNARFSWMKTLILGSCCKTTICVKSYSPMASRCYLRLHSQSLLRNFIDSLTFPPRLWVLLLISCFRKKFAGILSEKEMLGSKHHEGLAQTYARSCLPLSVFICRHEVFMEYCRHGLCACGNEQNYSYLKLMVPISNFITYCGATWIKILLECDTGYGVMETDIQLSRLACNGKSYSHPIKRIMQSENFGIVLLGKLKICLASGRLKLIDATGSIDVLIPDLPSNWSSNNIYEVFDFFVFLEGMPEQVDHLQSSLNESLSFRSIFNGIPLMRQTNVSLYLYYSLGNKQHRNKLFYPYNDLKETIKEIEGGRFHLLLVMHKFPMLHKFQGVNVVSSRSSAFVEAVILPWDLFIANKDEDLHSTNISNGANQNYRELVAHKRCKMDQPSEGPKSFCFDDSQYEFYDHTNYCVGPYTDTSYPLKVQCFVSGNDHSVCHGILHYTQGKVQVGSDIESATCKVLLEYQSENFSKYESLSIGTCYLVKHYKEDTICGIKRSSDVGGRKVVMTSEIHLLSVSFSFNEVCQDTFPPHIAPLHDSFIINKDILSKDSHQIEFPLLRFNSECADIWSDIHIFPSPDISSCLEVDRVFDGLIKPFLDLGRSTAFTSTSVQSSISGSCLPEGSLISLNGSVLGVHNSDISSFAGHLRNKNFARFQSLQFLQGETSDVCIHVLANHQIVKILGPSTEHAYPTGFGIGSNATFHRILVLGGQNEFELTPTSFIVVDSVRLVNEHSNNECCYQLIPLGSQNTACSDTVPLVLISDLTPGSDFKHIQFRCRVVALYILVLEDALYPSTRTQSTRHMFNIPFAGFIMDDGTSRFCCWVNCERVATLLRLHEVLLHISCRNSCATKTEKKGSYSSAIHRVNQILKQHGKIVIKNYGSMFDSSCQDLLFSVSADKVLSHSDEDLLKFILFNGCFGTFQNVVGSVMSASAVGGLKKRLTELGLRMHPLPNIWATEICQIKPTIEARKIIQEL